MSLGPGSRLDSYELIAPVGAGGMGEVWLAKEVRLGRKVALKLLPAELTRDAARVRRFEQEARAASALNHPNVCTIHALGETDEHQHYIAMEYVEGETLGQRLVTSRLSIREALDIGIQVGAALSVAHATGIVHRDIKPENVMLRPDGVVKVLDFGIAKLAAAASAGTVTRTELGVHTDPGKVVGTAAYMSPEQARGQQVDARTDIWSLGVMLYEMIAGRSPFSAPSGTDVLAAILQNEPPPLARFHPETPGELQRILTKTLRKDRAQRYQTVQDLLLDLQALRDDLQSHPRVGSAAVTPITTATAADGSAPPVAQTRRVNLRVALAMVAAMLLLGTVLGVWAWRTAGRPQPRAVSDGAAVQRTLTRLTFGSGLQTDVTWSPDGRFIAYTSDRTGNFDIWVQSVGGGDPVQVTRSAAHDLQPDWSSDGSTLVFRSERDGGGLFLVPALGGVERQLTSFGSYPFWSADKSEILFMDETRVGSSEGPVRLFVVSPEEGSPREILADFISGGTWSWIASHPDGRISAMGKHRQLGRGFFTVARDGRQLVQSKESPGFPLRVYDGGGFVRRRFRWHPAGTALYVQTQSNGVYNLWRVRVDPKTLLWVSAERLTTGAGPDVAPALSRDGTRLAFSTEQGTSRLWVFPLDPVARRLGSGRPLTEDGASAVTAALSPDGRFVAYNLLRPGIAREELRITDLSDGTSQLITTDGSDPCWSPDGKAIAYGYLRLDKQPITGRTAVRQLGGTERFVSRWSTDLFLDFDWSAERGLVGTYVISQSEVTSLAVWPLANPEADKPDRVLISKPDTGFWQAQVSPNGRWLSFVAIRTDRPSTLELGIAAADGSRPEQWRQIAADHVWPDKPRWAPDGRTLYFISRRPTSYFNLWAVRFDPERGTAVGQPFALTQFDSQSLVISPEVTKSDMDVSSRHVVLTLKTVTGSIWMLDNVDK